MEGREDLKEVVRHWLDIALVRGTVGLHSDLESTK
jgi:hypothetical protein